MTTTIKQEAGKVSTEIPTSGFRVIRIFGENVKRMKAFDIPIGPLVTKIGGKNGNGKSSAIGCIAWSLGGKKAIDADPIRHGQTKGRAGCEIVSESGRYVITQVLRAGKDPELKIETVSGPPPDTTPQAFLNGLHGVLNFDAEEFTRMGGAKRLETMLKIVRLDIDLKAHAIKRQGLYDGRTDIGRDLTRMRGALAQMPEPTKDAPTEAINVAALLEQKNTLDQERRANQQKRANLESETRILEEKKARVESLKRQLREADSACTEQAVLVGRLVEIVNGLVDPDTAAIDAQIADANRLNNLALQVVQYRRTEKQVHELQAAYDAATNKLADMDQAKEDALEAAAFPIPGLSFADGDISYEGTLFDQIGTANKIRVSFAIAMALNPKLRTIVVANGSLVDDDGQKLIYEMAEKAGFQAILEVVGNAPGASIIIEDGEVVEAGHGR